MPSNSSASGTEPTSQAQVELRPALSSNMLAISISSSSAAKCTPNVIPCRIHHTGPTKITKRHWAPFGDKDSVSTSYFRGRKLRGRTTKLPANYQGLVLNSTEKDSPQSTVAKRMLQFDDEEDDVDQEEPEEIIDEPVKLLEQMATFDELTVWGHDQIPASDDPFVRNIEEWIRFAEAIHYNGNTTQTNITDRQNLSTAANT